MTQKLTPYFTDPLILPINMLITDWLTGKQTNILTASLASQLT
jgi:hypothetical protein